MYEKYYELYMLNRVARQSLEKLVTAGKLTQEQIDKMKKDREDKYGY